MTLPSPLRMSVWWSGHGSLGRAKHTTAAVTDSVLASIRHPKMDLDETGNLIISSWVKEIIGQQMTARSK